MVSYDYCSYHMLNLSDTSQSRMRGRYIRIDESSVMISWSSSVRVEEALEMIGMVTHSYWNECMSMPVLFPQALDLALANQELFVVDVEIGSRPAVGGPVSRVLQDKNSRKPYMEPLTAERMRLRL